MSCVLFIFHYLLLEKFNWNRFLCFCKIIKSLTYSAMHSVTLTQNSFSSSCAKKTHHMKHCSESRRKTLIRYMFRKPPIALKICSESRVRPRNLTIFFISWHPMISGRILMNIDQTPNSGFWRATLPCATAQSSF
jgi:hypothetical protein